MHDAHYKNMLIIPSTKSKVYFESLRNEDWFNSRYCKWFLDR